MFRAFRETITKADANFLPTCFIAKQSLANHYSRCLVTNTITTLADMEAEQQQVQRYQNVLVMRHGDRLDNFESSWLKTAQRPWDPPLTSDGRTRARMAGANIRTKLGLPIRIFVSPFLRCLETAYEVIHGLCGVEDGDNLVANIESFKGKVSIEYGLCEMFNNVAIRHPPTEPKNGGHWGFIRADLEKLLPQHTVDPKAHRVFNQLPQWDEKKEEAEVRFKRVTDELANRYPLETLLLITHGEGVGVAVKPYLDPKKIKMPKYCSYAQLRRPIFENSKTFAGEFELEYMVGGPEIPGE